jgi:uncharacterized protein with GYD domain
LIFISFGKLRKRPTKEFAIESQKLMEKASKEGVKFLSFYFTLGRYDTVVIAEAPNEKTYMKHVMRIGDIASTETVVAIHREEVIELVE